MKRITPGLSLAAVLFAVGCASPNVNPSSPRADTGYIDFYADFSGDLSWNVEQYDPRAGAFKNAFYDVQPLNGRILRLAFPPGHYKLRVTFLNRVIADPGECEVEVRDGSISPVRVTLNDAGETYVQTVQTSVGGTLYGRYGRRTRIGSDESIVYRVAAMPGTSCAYAPKEQMPYAVH